MRDDELTLLLRQGAVPESRSGPECPEEGEIAAFVDGALESAAAASVRAHLARCGACLERVGFLKRLEASAPAAGPANGRVARVRPRPESRHPVGRASGRRWAPAAAVAAVLLLAVSITIWRRSEQPPPQVRNGPELLHAPEMVWPVEGSVVAVDRSRPLELRWTGVPEAIDYQVRLVTADGERVWEERTASDRIVLPPEATPAAGRDLFVWIRAYLPRGKSLQSEIVGFRLVEPDPATDGTRE